jgi:hypothetical protein
MPLAGELEDRSHCNGGKMKAAGGGATGEGAPCIASLHSPAFQVRQQGPADAAKPGVRRDIVESDLTRVGNMARRKDHRARHGGERKADPWRAGRQRL